MAKPFLNLTLTANNQTVTASFDAPAAGWDRADSSGNSDFATDSGFSSNVTSSTSHPAPGTTRESDFPVTFILGTNLTPGTTYHYRVRHRDRQGFSSYLSGNVTTAAAGSVPNAPGTPNVTDIQDGQISISWIAVSGASSYKVYCGTSSNPTTEDGTTTGNTYTKTGTTANTTYYFRLKATNATGDSAFSSERQALSMVTTPSAPSPVVATPTSNTITWSEVTGTVKTRLFGGTSANPTTTLTTVDSGTTTFSHTSLNSNDQYFYRIKQTNDSSLTYLSEFSSDGSVITLPPTPAGLSAAQGSGEGEIDLSWSQTVGQGHLTVTYSIQRATSSGGSFTTIAGSISSGTTTFTDTGLNGSTTFFYRMFSTTSAGSSPVSSEASATTAASSGPNPTNESLELGKLNVLANRGSDGATVSIQDVTGNTNETSLKDFFVGGFTSVTKNTDNIAPNNFALLTANFSNAGDRFLDKVAKERFSWSITSGGSHASLSNQSGRTIRCNSSNSFGSHTVTVSCTWTPIFNDHVTANLTRTVNVQMVFI